MTRRPTRPWLGNKASALLFLGLLAGGPTAAQTDPTITAQRASAMLAEASDALVEAVGARDRVAALTTTIRAFEEGLSAVREALRRSQTREASLLAELDAERDRLASLLAAMQTIERAPPPLLLLHPDGPEGSARSGMILSDIAPALIAETEILRRQLTELQVVRGLQDTAREDLTRALRDSLEARAALSEAIADRVALPPRVETDAERMQALLAAATSLDSLVSALTAAPLGPLPEGERIDAAQGDLPLPAFGTVLRGFNEADAAGIARPGLILATRAQALVTAPWSGTIRYAGPMPGDGIIVLLEPDDDHIIILAGFGEIFVATGEIVGPGAPLGLMGPVTATSEDLIDTATEVAGLSLSETLYIELRVENEPVDPAAWFRVTRQEDR